MRLYWHGHASIWDLPSAHALLSTLLGWRVRKLDVELYAEQGSLQALDEGNRYKLASLLELGASYHELPADVMQVEEAGLPLLAAVHRSDRWHLWATDAITLGLPDSEWGKPSAGGRLLRGQETVLPMAVAVGVGDIRPKTGDKEVDIRAELDGAIESFGQHFWHQLCEHSPVLVQLLTQDDIEELSYSDRYLRSPLPVSLLLSVLHALGSYPAGAGAGRKCRVFSQPFQNSRGYSHRVWHDWRDQFERDRVLQSALEYLGYNAVVQSEEDIAHGRLLKITFASGKSVRIRLDQGMSYWLAAKRHDWLPSYPFDGDGNRQMEALVNPVGWVQAPLGVSTQLFVRLN